MNLKDYQTDFIERWGEMGQRWGIGRSEALVHGLLYLAPHPLSAEEIGETLVMARSNVSTSVKELERWGLVYKESRRGERKGYYRAETDVWTMAQRVIAERKKREADGALRSVEVCLQAARDHGDPHTASRMEAMHGILSDACRCADLALGCRPGLLKRAVQAAGSFFHWLG